MTRFVSSLTAIWLGLIYCCLSVLAPAVVSAQSAATPPNGGSGQALEIAPPLITLNANPGQTIQAQIKLRDITSSKLLVSNQINDFVASGEDGTPKIITGDDSNNAYSIKGWITPLPNFLLSPQQIENLKITINIPANASPGGHYGVIRFTGTPPNLEGTGVSLSASLGALVLLTVNGQLNHNLSVKEFSAGKNGKAGTIFDSSPVNFIVRLQNNGNVQELPTGHIAITDMFGKRVASVNVNIPPHNVLPSSTRKFEAALDSTTIGNKRLFGRYHAVLSVVYGPGNTKIASSLVFWVIPWRLIAIVIVVLIAAFFALRYGIRRYNAHILSKAHGRRKR